METSNISKPQKYQILEEINVDVNDVLNFSINIDNLKTLLSTLIKNQSTLSQKIIDLEKRITKQSHHNSIKYISQSTREEKLKSQSSLDKEKKENGSEELKKDENGIEDHNESKEDNEKENIRKENEERKSELNNQEISDDLYLEDSNEKLFDLENKINSIEKKIKNLEILSKVNKFTSQVDDKSDDIQLMQIEIGNLKDSNKTLIQDNLDIKKQLEDIKVKSEDLNIFEILKASNVEDGSIDIIKPLIMNLEKKVFSKIGFIDERDKKTNQAIIELKTNIQNVVNKNGVISHNIENIKNNFKELGQLMTNNTNETTNMINNLESKSNNMYKELIDKFNEEKNNSDLKIKKINDKLGSLEKLKIENLNPNDLKNNDNPAFTEENLEFIQKMANRINEIESKINTILEEIKSFSTKDELIKIQKELIKKANTKEFYELKEKYNIQLAEISNLQDSVQRFQDMNEKNSSDLIFCAKRVESITSNMISIRTQIEDLIKKEQEKVLDLTKYLEKSAFNKYINSLLPEKIKINNNFEELRNSLNDMGNSLTKKCNAEDLKFFEDIINTKLEETKLLNSKKFADKIDMNRSLKYLDSQIKHIIDVYIKKVDKNESWLIAKNGFGSAGYLCASCESYIGNLKNKDIYMPWNKYPQREKDQNYRVGNGFSRMLNMLNVELKNNNDSNDKEVESDDEVKKFFEENRIKIRLKNAANNANNKGVGANLKNLVNRSGTSHLMKSNSNNNIFNHNIHTSRKMDTNIFPSLYLNKNEEVSTFDPNSPNNDIFDKNFFDNADLDNRDNRDNLENGDKQPQIVKIIKKTKNNQNRNENIKTERKYSNKK